MREGLMGEEKTQRRKKRASFSPLPFFLTPPLTTSRPPTNKAPATQANIQAEKT